MRVLLLADVHANLPALEAVFKAAAATGYDEAWCLGDIVGYGPFPNECVGLVRERCSKVISGNHDVRVVSASRMRRFVDQQKEEYKVFIFTWTQRSLTPASADYLKGLPGSARVTVAGHRVLLVHGSPGGMTNGLTALTPVSRLEKLAVRAKADIVLAGHTHAPFVRKAGRVSFVNPGSVGRPFDHDPRAAFMILDPTPRGVEIRTCHADYSQVPVLRRMKHFAFPGILVKAFAAATSPADVPPTAPAGALVRKTRQLMRRCKADEAHAGQVSFLALKIYDGLTGVHGFGPRERELLEAAALLHDIGFPAGVRGHHKAARDMILKDRSLPLSDRERMTVALLARYHRRALPGSGHREFSRLPDRHRITVERLAGILRVADGFDRSHDSRVQDIRVHVRARTIFLSLSSGQPLLAELEYGRRKSDLLARAFLKKVEIREFHRS